MKVILFTVLFAGIALAAESQSEGIAKDDKMCTDLQTDSGSVAVRSIEGIAGDVLKRMQESIDQNVLSADVTRLLDIFDVIQDLKTTQIKEFHEYAGKLASLLGSVRKDLFADHTKSQGSAAIVTDARNVAEYINKLIEAQKQSKLVMKNFQTRLEKSNVVLKSSDSKPVQETVLKALLEVVEDIDFVNGYDVKKQESSLDELKMRVSSLDNHIMEQLKKQNIELKKEYQVLLNEVKAVDKLSGINELDNAKTRQLLSDYVTAVDLLHLHLRKKMCSIRLNKVKGDEDDRDSANDFMVDIITGGQPTGDF